MTPDSSPHGQPANDPNSSQSRWAEAAASVTLVTIAAVIVAGEATPVGLLSDIARGVTAGESRVGLAVGWYALIAAVTSIPLTRLSLPFDRRRVLFICTGVFGVGYLITALATDLLVLLFGRGLAALGHGVFFAVAAPTVIRLSRDGAKARAGGRVAVGAAIGLVLGTPLATLLGQSAGWRTTMLVFAALSLSLAAAVAQLLPPLPAPNRNRPRSEVGVLATLRAPGLIVVLMFTVIVVMAHFALFTFVAPFADEFLNITGTAFAIVLHVYGAAAVIGSALAGRLVEISGVAGIRVAAAVFVAALIGIGLTAQSGVPIAAVPLLVLWGGAFSVLAVSTILAVLRRADGPRAETANALQNISFQIGIVTGSAVGSLCHTAGWLSALPLVAAAGGLVALTLLAFGGQTFRP